jgi:hypothetical protein
MDLISMIRQWLIGRYNTVGYGTVRYVIVGLYAGEPGHWGAWLELSCLITTREKLFALQLPDHWIR